MVAPLNSTIEQGESFDFSGYGEVYTYTVVQDPPAGFESQAPYMLALVRLDEGPIVTAQITDTDGEIAIGDRVEMVTRKLATEGREGMIVYGYKFRKVLGS
ncbi:Zn-ribbon domain-containing OB-fold protein [Phototrophicus methaneseepsis]|uniref:Zn-ribbon domain-containing OB-fold protein n=1 Tax=Phototrophicus methaneseepsis TaxID=2710758 RepID=A0A7S8E6K8_9CHLR|nr:Zn-ribbon domain-containing OB-fold protein [Phototrophicus methaneseepsis]QPC81248.1 Zn-ribbon domain-containing OB-fold protein [Phototrophicus methaneseepsis]